MAERRTTIITIDPELSYKRKLHYQEKHSGWNIFRGIFWGMYLFIIGIILATLVPATMSVPQFLGWAMILSAFFVIIFGFASALHLKLMKRYA
jgi:hypothetical protein